MVTAIVGCSSDDGPSYGSSSPFELLGDSNILRRNDGMGNCCLLLQQQQQQNT